MAHPFRLLNRNICDVAKEKEEEEEVEEEERRRRKMMIMIMAMKTLQFCLVLSNVLMD
jgi:hypothetical protein